MALANTSLQSYSPPRMPMSDAKSGAGVTELHPDYSRYMALWEKCRDVTLGEDAVKDAGEKYLPRMRDMDDFDYSTYKERAMFYGATGRTINGLLGAIFRKDPVVDGPTKLLNDWVRNITQNGQTLNGFSRDVVNELLIVGRVGVLVDMSSSGGNPYLRLYTTESILNWREIVIGGVPFLNQVIVREVHERPSLNGFGSEFYVVYRVLEMQGNVYVQRLFELQEITGANGAVETQIVETGQVTPLRRGTPLSFIPFVFINSENLRPQVAKPPLIDLVNVNLSHYRSSADLEHGRHFTALPTPVVTGVDQPEDQNSNEGALRIGSGTAWILPVGAQARMLEFNGQGLKHLENALTEKNEIMVNLGARMLETNKRAAETAEALRLRQAGDQSMLAVLAKTGSDGLTRALRWMCWWGDLSSELDDSSITFKLNTDFFESKLNPLELKALIEAWQKKAISFQDLYQNLLLGEIIDPDRDIEDVRADIMKDLEIESEISRAKAEDAAFQAKLVSEAVPKHEPDARPAPGQRRGE